MMEKFSSRQLMALSSATALLAVAAYYAFESNASSKRKASTKLRFDWSVGTIQAKTLSLLAEWKQVEDEIAALSEQDITFKNVATRLAHLQVTLSTAVTNVTFLGHVSADKTIRDACTEATKAIEAYGIKSSMRQDVYKVIKALSVNSKEVCKEIMMKDIYILLNVEEEL